MAVLVRDNLGYSFQLLDLQLNQLPTSVLPFFSAYHSFHRMSNYNETAAIAVPDNLSNDPVTKAVYENIMGNIPKKPKVTVFCQVCNLEFSSQVVLDTHLAGSKHQRKLKSKELLKSLEATESSFERNSVSGVIRCTICDVTVNSPQLLATHVAGNKHKSKKRKRENGEEGVTPAKKVCLGATEQSNGVGGQPTEDAQNAAAGANAQRPRKKERPPIEINIPACVTKLEDTKAGGKFLCNPCQAHCNSDIQLTQHLTSKKHLDKVSGKKTPAPGAAGGGAGAPRSWRGNFYGRGRGSSNRGGTVTQKWGGAASSTKFESLSAAQPHSNSVSESNYGQSSFPESSVSHYPSDSYGLPAVGRNPSEYSQYPRSTGTSRRAGGRRAVTSSYTRTERYVRADGGTASYPRAVSTYSRPAPEIYSDYAADYGIVGRNEDLTVFSRASAADYAPSYPAEYEHGYGSGHVTYTQPLSQNFVSGGSIL